MLDLFWSTSVYNKEKISTSSQIYYQYITAPTNTNEFTYISRQKHAVIHLFGDLLSITGWKVTQDDPGPLLGEPLHSGTPKPRGSSTHQTDQPLQNNSHQKSVINYQNDQPLIKTPDIVCFFHF